MRRVNAYHRDISIGVITDQVSRLTAAIRQRHHELVSAMHDMAVGQNKAVGRKDKSRAVATHVWCEARIRSVLDALWGLDQIDDLGALLGGLTIQPT